MPPADTRRRCAVSTTELSQKFTERAAKCVAAKPDRCCGRAGTAAGTGPLAVVTGPTAAGTAAQACSPADSRSCRAASRLDSARRACASASSACVASAAARAASCSPCWRACSRRRRSVSAKRLRSACCTRSCRWCCCSVFPGRKPFDGAATLRALRPTSAPGARRRRSDSSPARTASHGIATACASAPGQEESDAFCVTNALFVLLANVVT